MSLSIGQPRFGVYSYETYQRRQPQSARFLVGLEAIETFQRLKRQLPAGDGPWGGLIPDEKYLALLETQIMQSELEQLKAIDKAFETHDGMIPEQFAKAVECRALILESQRIQANLTRMASEAHYYRAAIQQSQQAAQKVSNELKALDFKAQYSGCKAKETN